MTSIISIKLRSLAKYESSFSVLAFIYVYVFLGKLDNTNNEIEADPRSKSEIE